MNFETISQRSGCVSVLHPWVRGEHSTALVCLGWTIARLPAASSGQPGLAQCPRDVEKSFDFCLEGSRVNPQLWLGCSALPAVLIEGTEELQKKPASQNLLTAWKCILPHWKTQKHSQCASPSVDFCFRLSKKRGNSFPRARVSAGPQLHPAQPLQSSQKLCFEAG